MAIDSARIKGVVARVAGPVATILKLGILAACFCLFLAGTLMTGGEHDYGQFILSSLKIATLTTPTTPPLHLYWFLDATTYFYPASNASSMVYNIDFLTPSDQLTLPKHLGRALRSASSSSRDGTGPPQPAWNCLEESESRYPSSLYQCTDPFFAEWAALGRASSGGGFTFSTALGLYALYAAFVLLTFAGPRRPRLGTLAAGALGFAAASLTGVVLRAKWFVESVADAEGRHMTVVVNGRFLAVVWGLVAAHLLSRTASVASRAWVAGGGGSWMHEMGRHRVHFGQFFRSEATDGSGRGRRGDDDDISVMDVDDEKTVWSEVKDEDEDVPQLGDLSAVGDSAHP